MYQVEIGVLREPTVISDILTDKPINVGPTDGQNNLGPKF